MSPTKTGRTTQITVRVEHDFVARLDALAERLSQPGLALGRADVMRMALVAGVEQFEVSAAKRRK